MVVANDPNNRRFFVTVADSTINENKGYSISDGTVSNESGESETTTVSITVDDLMVKDNTGTVVLEAGEKIVVTKMAEPDLNGIFDVVSVTQLIMKQHSH